ncbi:MAG: hypothetical protein ACYTDY_16110 [Planctomycetota bacterium]|jgi:hypothetical protein
MSRAAIYTTVLLLAASVLLAAPAAWALCAPSARGIFPASGLAGTMVTATVSGSGLAGATASVLGEPGLAVSVQSSSDTSASLQLTIDAAAAPGERIISLTTPGGTVSVSFTVNPAGGLVVDSVSPTPIAKQGIGLDLAISGQNLAGLDASNVTVSGNGVTVSSATAAPDGTLLDLSLDVAVDAEPGTHAVVIESVLGGAVLQLYVQRPAPSIAMVSPGAGEIGTTVPLTITGANLTGAALVITSGAGGPGGVTISDVVTPDDSTLTATLVIDAALSPEGEPRLLIVTTESGQVTAEFFIVEAGVPTLTGTRPGAGEPGETVGVTLRGLNLTGATVSTLAADLTLQNVVVQDDETVTLEVVVAAGATPDTDHTITATVGADSDDVSFRVIATNAPFIGAVRPSFGNRGATVTVFLDGVNLASVVPGTGVALSGPKITESNAEAIDDATVRAILDIEPDASIGFRDVTVTTSSGPFTKSAAFRVNIPGQVPAITDVTPRVVEPGTTTTITVAGANFAGAWVTLGGPGATASNVAVDATFTVITFDLTLAADAPAESRPLIVVTEFGLATCGILSLPGEIELRAAQLVKTGSVFEVLTTGYRLFLFEFSINERFDAGLRTHTISSTGPQVTLTRLDAVNVGRAVRDLPFGYVRVRAVTATSQLGSSAAHRFRR